MIRNGIDRVTDAPYRSLLEHLRLGLVSNMSGISPRHGWRSTVDVCHSCSRYPACSRRSMACAGCWVPAKKSRTGATS